MVERITIKEIQEIVSDISKELNEDSVLFEDFTWFSTNKYTVPSEYIGELLLFIKKIKNNVEVSSHKDELTILENKLGSFFDKTNNKNYHHYNDDNDFKESSS